MGCNQVLNANGKGADVDTGCFSLAFLPMRLSSAHFLEF